ncbi:MAG TPA: glycosyltransferase [Patescibacteria group bacterium]|nr:glycosyltransferase [Patescibacteria group bacterium]
MEQPLFLSVIIPCFDEMANLQKGVLDKVNKYLQKKQFTYEVIIVDDGSTDGSVNFIEKFIGENKGFSLLKDKHTGKAGAVTAGVLKSTGKIVLFTDMDQATPIEELDKLLPYFKEGYDVVIGSRAGRRIGAPMTRRIVSHASILLTQIIVGIKNISDTQCGFKAFTSPSAKDLFTKLNTLHHGYKEVSGSAVTSGFDVELLYLSQSSGYKVKEVPVNWLHVETRRVNIIKDSIMGVVDLLTIRKNIIAGVYKNL